MDLGNIAGTEGETYLWAHEVDEDDMQERRADHHEEELPLDLGEGDRAGDEDDDIGQVQTHHAEAGALGTDMCWEDLGAASRSVSWPIGEDTERLTHRGTGWHP